MTGRAAEAAATCYFASGIGCDNSDNYSDNYSGNYSRNDRCSNNDDGHDHEQHHHYRLHRRRRRGFWLANEIIWLVDEAVYLGLANEAVYLWLANEAVQIVKKLCGLAQALRSVRF